MVIITSDQLCRADDTTLDTYPTSQTLKQAAMKKPLQIDIPDDEFEGVRQDEQQEMQV